MEDIERDESSVRHWMNRIFGEKRVDRVEKNVVSEGAMVMRQGGEAGLTGVILGALDAEVGLDTAHDVPIDGVIALLGLGTAVAKADQEYSTDARNVGSSAFAIFTYRKTKELMELKKGPGMAGEDDAKKKRDPSNTADDPGKADPVVEAARGL